LTRDTSDKSVDINCCQLLLRISQVILSVIEITAKAATH